MRTIPNGARLAKMPGLHTGAVPLKVIGLTGGIASGKSTASRYLSERGAFVIDADKLGHAAYEPGTQAFQQVVDTFGGEIVGEDGQIDRKALGAKVFGEGNRLTELTDIVWPEILRLAVVQIEERRKSHPDGIVALEAAVLLEAGWESVVDELWVVVVDPGTAIERAMARDGVDRAAIQARIDAQLSNDERAARADVLLSNSADEAALVSLLDVQWQRLAG
jgi:dephospho-CoA kinase